LFWGKSTGERKGGILLVDYAKLAAKAKVMQDAEKLSAVKHNEMKVDPKAFFNSVREHLIEEMTKANVELRKRKAGGFGRNHMPGFDDEVFITFGTDLLCRVTLEVMGGRCRITAVISGPPNGFELSRREYPFNQGGSNSGIPPARGTGSPTAGASPYQIAVNIVSSVLAGKFD
jgi:hypothetical protein